MPKTDWPYSPRGVYFLPLGGCGEIGMNLSLYGHDDAWLMVDLGVAFQHPDTGIRRRFAPDIRFPRTHRGDLVGLVLTHAHEDHLGAVPALWPQLQCPVFATPFTADILRAKLEPQDPLRAAITVVPRGGRQRIGPFDVEWLEVTHSVPEANALVLRTPRGTLLHTGDWKRDPAPLVTPAFDPGPFEALAREGVAAVISDSTNAHRPGRAGSERAVADRLHQLIRPRRGRIVVTGFASNLGRLAGIQQAADASDRAVGLLGRSLERFARVGARYGYRAAPRIGVPAPDLGYFPRDHLVVACTGSQGEPAAALARLAADQHPALALEAGDTVIVSARTIPGNEADVARVVRGLQRLGVEVIDWTEDPAVHASGHPPQADLIWLYTTLRPRRVLPMHGDPPRLAANAQLARDCGIRDAPVVTNGTPIRLLPGPARVLEPVPAGVIALDEPRGSPAPFERARPLP